MPTPLEMHENWHLWVAAGIGLALAAGLATGVEEWFSLKRRGRLTRAATREMALSLSPLPLNTLTALLTAGTWTALYGIAERLTPWQIAVTPASLLTALIAVDLCYYVEHRAAHRCNLLWVLYHAVHHSSRDYTVATAYRVSFANQFVAPFFFVPCVLAGFEPLLVVTLQIFVIHYQAWVHTELVGPLRWLDPVVNTPANHRVHHDAELGPGGANFGGVLIVWDRLFGTYRPAYRVNRYGIRDQVPPTGWLNLYTYPWRYWRTVSNHPRARPPSGKFPLREREEAS